MTGFKIAKMVASKYEIYGTYNFRPVNIENCFSSKIDISDEDQVSQIFLELKPDIVINATALHNVDYCQNNQNEADIINTKAIKLVHENSEKFGTKFVHISTDYVFDGTTNTPYDETDDTNPLSYYGKTKLAGEKILENTKHLILRPSVVYGWTPLELAGITSSSGKPMNFALWALTKLSKREPLKIVTDQFASATLADSLAESILKMVESDKSGLYHVSGLSCESRYDFTIKLAEKFGHDISLISPITSESFIQKAKRPSYSCLNCAKAIKDFGLNLLTTDESLDMMKKQVEKEAPHLLGK